MSKEKDIPKERRLAKEKLKEAYQHLLNASCDNEDYHLKTYIRENQLEAAKTILRIIESIN